MSILSYVRPDRNVPALRASGSVRALLFSWWRFGAIRDRIDERRARRLREAFGPRGDLLSWQPEPAGGWRSRLSCPGLVYTIERVGATRVAAIERTLRARTRILRLRVEIQVDRMLDASQDPSD